MNQDQLKEIGQKLLKRLDLVITGALLLLLGLSIAMVLGEKNAQPPDPPSPTPRRLEARIPLAGIPAAEEVQNPNYTEVRRLIFDSNPDINSNLAARRMIVNNMFAMKTAAEAEAVREEVNRKYNQAERLFKEGNTGEAGRLVDEILLVDPQNRNARELRERLNAQATQ
jgi:hypothetical protein